MLNAIFDTGMSKACEKCKRHKQAKRPYMEKYGEGKKEILLVMDFPSQKDDIRGRILQGDSRGILTNHLKRLGYSLERDFWVTAAVKCYSPKEVSKTHVKHCREKLNKEIEELKPKAVIVLGSKALDTIVGHHLSKSSIQALAGSKIPYMDTVVCPVFSPRTILANPKDANLIAYFKRSLKETLDYIENMESTPEIYNPYDAVEPLTEFDQVERLFKFLATYTGATAFDYEATGLKPFRKGHKITTMSIATEEGDSYAFPVDYQGWWGDKLERVKALIRGYLRNKVYKIAHGAQFETMWSKAILGITPHIDWCTMTSGHLEDTREGRNSLKLQAFLRWGVTGYEDDAKKYIEAAEGEEFNRMEEMPIEKQLFYVGADSHLTMKLFLEQEKALHYNIPGVTFFNESLAALSELTKNGICVDVDWYNKQDAELTKEIKNLEGELYESQEVIRHMNDNNLKDWLYTSTDQLKSLLFESLGLGTDKETASGKKSVDEEALTKMGHWIPDQVIKLRKLLKLRDTYLAQFLREVVDGKINPEFTLHVARSLRSSSFGPNFQNLPKRNEKAKRVVRAGLKPSPGRKLFEIDFSGIEVSTSVLYHKDPNFLNYLLDDSADMHRDGAADIWMTPGDNISKKVRFYAKNCWTFPQFYGDYYGSCAVALWEHRHEKLKDGQTCLENLKKKGCGTYKKFVKHLKGCEDILWNKRFKVYTAWKNKINRQYQRQGFIETYFGFRYTGYLDKKQVANYPIQGTAFHILLWCLVRLLAIAKEEGWKSKFIGQVHDSMIVDMLPEEELHILKTIKHVCEREVVDNFDWITTQFRVDIEASEIDGNFSELKEYELAEAA